MLPVAFLCNVPNTSRTSLFSDKAWIYKRYYVRNCCDFSLARLLGMQRRYIEKRCATFGFDSPCGFAFDRSEQSGS